MSSRSCLAGAVSGTAYFVGPLDGPGPGVLLLHSWWGLTGGMKRTADRLADEGFTVIAPDLNGGEVFGDLAEAQAHLSEADPNRLARLTLDTLEVVRDRSSGDRIGIVGYSKGASRALWASVRTSPHVAAVVAYYGTQTIDFAGSEAAYLLHEAGRDELVDHDEMAFMEATIGLDRLDLEVFRYPEASHFFAEEGAGTYDPEAAHIAFGRSVALLRDRLAG